MNYFITDPNGEMLASGPANLLDCKDYAKKHCEDMGLSLDTADGYVPDGCGDFNVTISNNPIFHPVCWSSRSYFYAKEDDQGD
jgi:hypothetical protein